MIETAETFKKRKKRVTLLIWCSVSIIIITLTLIFTTYHILNRIGDEKKQMEYAYNSVLLTYTESIRDLVDFYAGRSNSTLNALGVLDAIKARDHSTLNLLILPRWEVLRKENAYLTLMQFHNADGTSLLRMHDVRSYGDNTAAKRPMVYQIHNTHSVTAGFEEGKNGLAFRILVPIMDHGHYRGALEFGISVRYIIDKIMRYTHYQSFILVNKEYIGKYSYEDHNFRFGSCVAIEIPHPVLGLVKEYSEKSSYLKKDTVLTFQNISYAIKYVPITNYLGEPMGMIVFTREVPDFKKEMIKISMVSTLIALSLIALFGFLITRIYERINNKIMFQELYNQTILNTIPSPIIVTNGKEIIAANKTFLDFFRYVSLENFKSEHNCVCNYFEEGDTDDYLLPTQDDQLWTEYIYTHPNTPHKAKITIDANTVVFDVQLSRMSVKEEERYVVVFTNISSIQNMTTTDQLTGIANRMHFSMVFEHAINVARREARQLAVIFFDIDHFKHINDLYGHLAGDAVLKQLAALVTKRIRKSDFFARWGGEEFIVLLPSTELEEGIAIANELRSVIEKEPFEIAGPVTCSFGVSVLQQDDSPHSLLKRVDEFLYTAKGSGRNCIIYGYDSNDIIN